MPRYATRPASTIFVLCAWFICFRILSCHPKGNQVHFADRLCEEAAQLPEDQELSLAYRLLAADEPRVTEEIEQQWDIVIRERIQHYDQGEACTRSACEAYLGLASGYEMK
jgi:hypothetical protein